MWPDHSGTRRQAISRALWGDASPYANFPHRRYRPDDQGWNSRHFYLSDTIARLRPAIVVEIGVWKGASVIYMAETIRAQGLDTPVIAIDTSLGSVEHWLNDEWRQGLLFANGYPTLFYTFLTNVMERGLQDIVVPLPLDAQNAFQVLGTKQIRPGMIHLDAGHDYYSVTHDLHLWWHLLEPGGAVVVDDYDPTGATWPEVRKAVDDFLRAIPHEQFEAHPLKCRFFNLTKSHSGLATIPIPSYQNRTENTRMDSLCSNRSLAWRTK